MQSKGYHFAVAWIAENDDAGSIDATDLDVVSGYISVLLIADIFQKNAIAVANDVVRYRKKKGILGSSL
jgi:hypothetical protein